MALDSRVATSSVKLLRDYGNISDIECQQYQKDYDAVKNKEKSFQDFITSLQSGAYSRPVSSTRNGDFCEQITLDSDEAAKLNTLDDYDKVASKVKTVRIRQVTGGGSFSSGTKAKFKLSLPINVRYVTGIQNTPQETSVMQHINGAWTWGTKTTSSTTPILENISVSMMTLYHPSPLRIENVQHDAVLSLNDPSDPTAKAVILIPLKSSNSGTASTDFFSRIVPHLQAIVSPDSVTGLYPEVEIPTGNQWNIKNVFWLDPAETADSIATVTDAFYTWMGAGSYNRTEISRSSTEIRYGWKPDGAQVRYFMLQTPVAISSTDLSTLTRCLPQTVAEEAIHKIPDPAMSGNPKVLYKQATGDAAAAGCPVRSQQEHMTNMSSAQGPGDMMASLFTSGGTEDLLVDETGTPLSDKESCDPFANNAKNIHKNPSPFTPTKAVAFFFNVMLLVAMAFGTWLAMFLVVNKNYDYTFRDFSKDAGKVVATLALQTSGRMKDIGYLTSKSFSSAKPDDSDLKNLPPGALAAAKMFGKKA